MKTLLELSDAELKEFGSGYDGEAFRSELHRREIKRTSIKQFKYVSHANECDLTEAIDAAQAYAVGAKTKQEAAEMILEKSKSAILLRIVNNLYGEDETIPGL